MRLRTKIAWLSVGFQMCGVFILLLCKSPAIWVCFVFAFLSWIIAEDHSRQDEERLNGKS